MYRHCEEVRRGNPFVKKQITTASPNPTGPKVKLRNDEIKKYRHCEGDKAGKREADCGNLFVKYRHSEGGTTAGICSIKNVQIVTDYTPAQSLNVTLTMTK